MTVPTEAEVLATFPGDQLLLAIAMFESHKMDVKVKGKDFDTASRRRVRQGLATLGIMTFGPPTTVEHRDQGGTVHREHVPPKATIDTRNLSAINRIKERLAAGELEGYERWP